MFALCQHNDTQQERGIYYPFFYSNQNYYFFHTKGIDRNYKIFETSTLIIYHKRSKDINKFKKITLDQLTDSELDSVMSIIDEFKMEKIKTYMHYQIDQKFIKAAVTEQSKRTHSKIIQLCLEF